MVLRDKVKKLINANAKTSQKKTGEVVAIAMGLMKNRTKKRV